jgi:hypothetical protein
VNPAARHVPRAGDDVEVPAPLLGDEFRDRAWMMAQVGVHDDDELSGGVR